MRKPNQKKISNIVPDILRRSTVLRLEMEYGNKHYDIPKVCPRCKSENYTKADWQQRVFCRVIKDEGIEELYVYLKKYRCKDCGHIYASDGPFYPHTCYGSPIVDLVLYLASYQNFDQIERTLMDMGIQLDRDTARGYVTHFGKKAKEYAGIKLFRRPIAVNILQILFNTENVSELRKKFPDERYDAVADETYPVKKGAKKELKKANREGMDGKPLQRYPDSFTLALSYLPGINAYASILLSCSPFNRMLAYPLLAPLEGADMICTDANPSYNIIPHELCLVHKLRNMAKRDRKVRDLRKNGDIDGIRKYLSEVYQKRKEELIKILKEKYPNLVRDGIFTGAVTTNAMEGGNFRMKWMLRVPYSNIDACCGRSLLAAIYDSIYTFRCGRPWESFGNKHSTFQYANIMKFEPGEDENARKRSPFIDEVMAVGNNRIEAVSE